MSHTVSSQARAERENGYSFECFAFDGSIFRSQGGFATQPEAIAAAQIAEREMMFGLPTATMTLDELMSDDELLAELLG